jgi:hypothetical protein
LTQAMPTVRHQVIQVDTIDANEIQLCLGADLGGLTSAKAPPVVADIDDLRRLVARPLNAPD